MLTNYQHASIQIIYRNCYTNMAQHRFRMDNNYYKLEWCYLYSFWRQRIINTQITESTRHCVKLKHQRILSNSRHKIICVFFARALNKHILREWKSLILWQFQYNYSTRASTRKIKPSNPQRRIINRSKHVASTIKYSYLFWWIGTGFEKFKSVQKNKTYKFSITPTNVNCIF